MKKSAMKVLFGSSVGLGVIALLVFAAESLAFPYRPADALSIQSEYTVVRSSGRPHTQVWRVVPVAGADGSMLLRFFLEAAADTTAICELRLPPPGAAGEIQWTAGKTGQTKRGAGVLLVPGFPAPCDVLPVAAQDSGRVYEEKAEAGGRVFSQSFRVSVAAIDPAEAKERGWIRAEDPGRPGLTMVSVTDGQGRPVVKQLWPAEGSWWLYEETPVRRSWVIQ